MLTVKQRDSLRRSWRPALGITAIAVLVSLMHVAPAHARLSYPSCRALHHRFEHGVARSSAAAELQVAHGHGMPAHGRHARNVYRANRAVLDHDDDGTVCEG